MKKLTVIVLAVVVAMLAVQIIPGLLNQAGPSPARTPTAGRPVNTGAVKGYQTSRDTILVPGFAILDGSENGEVVVPQINIWTTADRRTVACQIGHGYAVKAEEARLVDGRWIFRVTGNDCTGWVSELFLIR